jgi:SAM-dependent methyltransferase
MAQSVCPWWLGYLLASPLRRLIQDPARVLTPYIHEGTTVLEPGPGMGFFTLEIARLVGPAGRVVAIDIQPRMLDRLKRRAARAGLLGRVDARVAAPDNLGIADLAGSVDFTLAFALVHELPAPETFFLEVAKASKPGAGLLFAEPAGHVKAPRFEAELAAAIHAGFKLVERPAISRSRAAFLKKV